MGVALRVMLRRTNILPAAMRLVARFRDERAAQIAYWTLAGGLALICFGWAGGTLHAEQKARRVLLLYPYNTTVPANVIAGEAAKKRLTERSIEPIEFYIEFLDFARFNSAEHRARTARHLAEKYQGQKFDVVMALGPQSLRFAIQNRQSFDAESPIVFCCTSPSRLATLNPPPDVTGIISEFDLSKTLALAQRLHPLTRKVFVVAGAAEFDKQWIEIARRQLKPFEHTHEIQYLAGLPHDELIGKLKAIPRESIVLLLTIFADGLGRKFIPTEIAGEIATAANAPVYSPYETHLGRGVVGGHSDSFVFIGNELAELTMEILSGTKPSALPARPTKSNAGRVDWRELKRWNISETRLPKGTEVRFRQFSLWERYHWYLLGVLAVVLLQAILTAWLIFERHRRERAELELRRRLLEIIHLNRSAAAGALSSSFAHELNQPLGSILNNTETAEDILSARSPDLGQLKDILADIRRDNQRAAKIITNLRGLLRGKNENEVRNFDLNETVREAASLLNSEAIARGTELTVNSSKTTLPVCANEVHLLQVIVNLAINALDAMVAVSGPHKMKFETSRVDDAFAEVTVSDSGTGIPRENLKEVFEAFYTTKPQGTGIGLSIASTIIEIYGGKIWAENHVSRGAVFRFNLPLVREGET